MPKILAVDDSVTMRRVLELTFAGLDGFEVVSFDSGDAAFAHAQASGGDLVIADASMSPDGYELCQKLKGDGATSGIPVLILGSQHHAIDADRAKSVGADDTALKPYDTNTFIEKVKATIAKGSARPAGQVATYRSAPQAAPVPAAAAAKKPMLELAEDDEPEITVGGGAPTPAVISPPTPAVPVPGVIGRPPAPAPAAAPVKQPTRPTVGFGTSPLASARPATTPTAAKPPVPAVAAPTPAPAPVAPVVAPATPAASSAAASAAASVAPKLEGMGLTPAQIEAVVALTKEVVERVVWEVVPDLAETIIREEIKRLTR